MKRVLAFGRTGFDRHFPDMSEQRVVALPSEREEPAPSDVAARRGELPLPSDIRSFMLTGIFTILVFHVLFVGQEVFVPIFFAMLLNLLLAPAMRGLARLHVPRPIAAFVVILLVFFGISALGFTLAGPATEWLAKAPQTFSQLESRLSVLRKPVQQVQEATKQVERIAEASGTAGGAAPTPVTVKGPGLAEWLLAGTQNVITGFVTTMVLLFFLLFAGDLFLRRLVEILPTLSDKKQAVDISKQIERNISGYLVTITAMNAAVGLATGIVFHLVGIEDAVLWGAVAFLLNYVPILGPICGIGLFFIVGLTVFDTVWNALLPAGLYLVIHLIEGEAVTPMLLARRFTLNPVLVIGSLVFWHWMWGIPGALLAVPLLAVFKIVCDRVRPLMALGHFLGGENSAGLTSVQRAAAK